MDLRSVFAALLLKKPAIPHDGFIVWASRGRQTEARPGPAPLVGYVVTARPAASGLSTPVVLANAGRDGQGHKLTHRWPKLESSRDAGSPGRFDRGATPEIGRARR
jgi:hypothetical protein